MSEKTNEQLIDAIEEIAARYDIDADKRDAPIMRQAIDRLRQQSEDSARLDCVIELQAEISRAGKSWSCCWFEGLKRRRVDGNNPRAAIDKARKA